MNLKEKTAYHSPIHVWCYVPCPSLHTSTTVTKGKCKTLGELHMHDNANWWAGLLSSSPAPLLKSTSDTYDSFQSFRHALHHHKCLFWVVVLDFLGHHIDQHGITPLPEKVKVVQDFPAAPITTPIAPVHRPGKYLPSVSPPLCWPDAIMLFVPHRHRSPRHCSGLPQP